MTSQLISRESRQLNSLESAKTAPSSEVNFGDDPYLSKVMRSYQAAQQVEYLHLQAEIEVLLQQLQTIKQQRLKKKTS
ncbi:hypothetical protein PCC7424_0285 [Gloeothece citriformis PCC 7424]|uniref:Uncharacterized protein n=1 Tax=Gloeothece citriformis (strain PCC 7424) TaxID=65393 RepID=B7KAT1_GLOC7|nr:hypothetical protein [Gloeothece citriformis]ACK68753.1 hypothetical protein PCC7424_0285 [Gloeothece citriformis PCC 7424]